MHDSFSINHQHCFTDSLFVRRSMSVPKGRLNYPITADFHQSLTHGLPPDLKDLLVSAACVFALRVPIHVHTKERAVCVLDTKALSLGFLVPWRRA